MTKIFYRPCKSTIVTQDFGEDRVCFKEYSDGTRDYKTKRTDQSCSIHGPEYKSLYYLMSNKHNGIDWYAQKWEPLYAAQGGVVTKATRDNSRGIYVEIESIHDGKRLRHRYKHLMGYSVSVGQIVKTGHLIGWAGDTGKATGAHLHFDVRQFNESGNVVHYNNGMFGFLDPRPLLDQTIFARDVGDAVSTITRIKSILHSLLARMR